MYIKHVVHIFWSYIPLSHCVHMYVCVCMYVLMHVCMYVCMHNILARTCRCTATELSDPVVQFVCAMHFSYVFPNDGRSEVDGPLCGRAYLGGLPMTYDLEVILKHSGRSSYHLQSQSRLEVLWEIFLRPICTHSVEGQDLCGRSSYDLRCRSYLDVLWEIVF